MNTLHRECGYRAPKGANVPVVAEWQASETCCQESADGVRMQGSRWLWTLRSSGTWRRAICYVPTFQRNLEPHLPLRWRHYVIPKPTSWMIIILQANFVRRLAVKTCKTFMFLLGGVALSFVVVYLTTMSALRLVGSVIGKYVEESGHCPFEGTVLTSSWRDWGHLYRLSQHAQGRATVSQMNYSTRFCRVASVSRLTGELTWGVGVKILFLIGPWGLKENDIETLMHPIFRPSVDFLTFLGFELGVAAVVATLTMSAACYERRALSKSRSFPVWDWSFSRVRVRVGDATGFDSVNLLSPITDVITIRYFMADVTGLQYCTSPWSWGCCTDTCNRCLWQNVRHLTCQFCSWQWPQEYRI
jgi:hypothetical protein